MNGNMPRVCCAYKCNNRSVKGSTKTFHTFPLKNAQLLKKWISATRRAKFIPTKFTYICSDHFTLSDYVDPPNTFGIFKPRLREDAIPSIFDFSEQKRKNKSGENVEMEEGNRKKFGKRLKPSDFDPNDFEAEFSPAVVPDQFHCKSDNSSNQNTPQFLYISDSDKDNKKIKSENDLTKRTNRCFPPEETVEFYVDPQPDGISNDPCKKFDSEMTDSNDTVSDDHTYVKVNGKEQKAVSPTVIKLRKKVRHLNQIIRRKNQRIDSLQDVIKDLKEQMAFLKTNAGHFLYDTVCN